MGFGKLEWENQWDPQDMKLGSREGCYTCSSADLGKRLGNWTRGNRERRENLQSTWHYSGGVPDGIVGCDKEKSEKMEVRKGSSVGSGKKFSAHVLKQHKEGDLGIRFGEDQGVLKVIRWYASLSCSAHLFPVNAYWSRKLR